MRRPAILPADTVGINHLQSKGLKPYVQRITLPATWHAATLGYEASPDGEQWAPLTDLPGPIPCPAQPGQQLASGAAVAGVAWVRLTSSPPQSADVTIALDISAVGANDGKSNDAVLAARQRTAAQRAERAKVEQAEARRLHEAKKDAIEPRCARAMPAVTMSSISCGAM